jgi:hypothetical protein
MGRWNRAPRSTSGLFRSPETQPMTDSLDALQPDPRNARTHSKENLDLVSDSLREVGASRSIIIDEEGGSGRHCAGTRVRCAARLPARSDSAGPALYGRW